MNQKRKILFVVALLAILGVVAVVAATASIWYPSSTTHFQSTTVNTAFNPLLTSDYNSSVPVSAVAGTIYSFSVTLTNPSNALASPSNCLVYFTIAESTPALSSDVLLQYNNAGTWTTIPLTVAGDTLTGTFGGAGFAIPAGYNQTSQFQITFNATGTFSGYAEVGTAT